MWLRRGRMFRACKPLLMPRVQHFADGKGRPTLGLAARWVGIRLIRRSRRSGIIAGCVRCCLWRCACFQCGGTRQSISRRTCRACIYRFCLVKTVSGRGEYSDNAQRPVRCGRKGRFCLVYCHRNCVCQRGQICGRVCRGMQAHCERPAHQQRNRGQTSKSQRRTKRGRIGSSRFEDALPIRQLQGRLGGQAGENTGAEFRARR